MEKAKLSNKNQIVKIFSIASFLNDMGSDMIYPIWPVFVTQVLGANMAILGLIDGLGDAVVSISQAVAGYFSDKFQKRKPFIWAGYLMGALARVGYAFSGVWQYLIPFRILDRAGKIRAAPRDAIIADVSNSSNRGRNFGLLRAMDNLGAVVGILITVLLFNALGYKKLFLLAAIPSIIGVLLIIFFVKETPAAKKIFKGVSFGNLDFNFKLFLVLSVIFSLGAFSYSFLLVFAEKFGVKTVFLPLFYLLFTAIASLISFPAGKLSDKIGRKTIILGGLAAWILVSLIFIQWQETWAIILGFIFFGAHRGAIDTAQKTFIAELAPPDLRASTLGGFQMLTGLAALPASLIAGALWDKINFRAPFYFSAALTAVALILMLFVREKRSAATTV